MISDGVSSEFVIGAVAIHIPRPPPVPPTALADAYTCLYNATCVIDAGVGVLANDVYPNPGAALAVLTANTTDPAVGALALSADGSFTFTPPE